MNAKLYELEKFDSTEIVDYEALMDVSFKILPFIESKKACENESFLKGTTIIREMLKSLARGEDVEGAVINDAMDYFSRAAMENINEAYANKLWCVFFIWTQQYTDLKALKKFQARVLLKQVDLKEMIYETKKNDKKTANKRKGFIEDFDEILNELISMLKKMEQWSQLGDYYLALRYILGMVDTGCSNEMNQAVGMQMMIAFAHIGNKYALDFFNANFEKK